MQTIGIDIDGNTLKVVKLDENKNLTFLKTFNLNATNTPFDVKQLYIESKGKTLITTGLDLKDVLIKTIDFKVKNSLFLNRTIKYQKELITTIDPTKTITISKYIKKRSEIKNFITTKDLIKKHLGRLDHIKIAPDQISMSSQALCKFSSYFYKEVSSALIIHIDEKNTKCVYMLDSLSHNTFTIKIGINKLKAAFIEDGKNSFSKIDVLKLDKTSKFLELLNELKSAIEKAFISFTKKQEIKIPMIITGDISYFLNLDKFFKIDKIISVLSNIKTTKIKDINKYAISFGLALNPMQSKNDINFRKGIFTSNKLINNIGKKIISFFFVTILILSVFQTVSSHFLQKKQNKLFSKLKYLENFEEKHFQNNDNLQQKPGQSKTNINDKNFFQKLNNYEKKISNQLRVFPYFLRTYNVTETLEWLNNNKYLKNSEIINFSYNLEKYPTMFSKKTSYLAKVEIDFKVKTSSIARGFYDSLLQGYDLVDNTKEITWDVNSRSYKTSFYLKSRKK